MKRLLAVLLPLTLLSGCAPADTQVQSQGCDGVEVQVNFGTLNQDAITSCVNFEGTQILAIDALHEAGVGVEGTLSYPEAIICRVNGLPASGAAIEVDGEQPYFESCQDMPPAFAYWALWVMSDSAVGWEYATEGASTLQLKRGESIGLAFATGGQELTPTS